MKAKDKMRNFISCFSISYLTIVNAACQLIALCVLLVSCNSHVDQNMVNYSTSVDSALIYYQQGWQEIMDYGDYAAAEVSYRKSLDHDSEFLVGKSVLARLTLDLDERIQLYESIQAGKHAITGDERLILDVYSALTKYTNLRDQKSPLTKRALKDALDMGEHNFRKIVHTYPEEIYLKCEYIEILHSQYGAAQSLDSLNKLVADHQQTNPFLLGYKAILTAEMKNYNEALEYALQLKEQMKNLEVAKPDAILADIYFKMKDYENAKLHADKAFQIDHRNLDASRLKEKIDVKLDSLNGSSVLE